MLWKVLGKKIPYIAVVGKKEIEEGTVSLRKRGEKDSKSIKIEEFEKLIKNDEENRTVF